MAKIEIIVSPKGETTMSVRGAKGATCRQLTAGLEQRIGTVLDTAATAEFYETEDIAIKAEHGHE